MTTLDSSSPSGPSVDKPAIEPPEHSADPSSTCNPSLLSGPLGARRYSKPKDPWSDLGLDRKIAHQLNLMSLIPNEFLRRIIRSILRAQHLEIIAPPQSLTTKAVEACLMSFLALELKNHPGYPIPSVTSPLVLVLCLSPERVNRHLMISKQLALNLPGLGIDHIHPFNSLSTDLQELSSPSIDRPVLMTTLTRSNILLQHHLLALDRLSIIVIDLRHSNQFNHHTVAELEPLINSLGPQVQIILLFSLDARIPNTLSNLITCKMESSIRINLSNSSSSATISPSTSPTLSSSNTASFGSPNFNHGGKVFESKPLGRKYNADDILLSYLKRTGVYEDTPSIPSALGLKQLTQAEKLV